MRKPALTFRMFANPIANSASPFERNLSDLNPTEASFSTIADGGFGGASLSFENMPRSILEEAINDWRMKRVTFTDSAGFTAYEGFVAEIVATIGQHVYTWSVDAFFNRAVVSYQYAGGTCPAGATCNGQEIVNETALDATYATQAQLGIKDGEIDNGPDKTTAAQANLRGKRELADVLKPLLTRVTLGSGAQPQANSLQLTLWSAWSTLMWRKVNLRNATPGEIRSLIINALTTGNKAQYIDTSDLTQMETTGRLIPYNTSASPMWIQDYIMGAIEQGNSVGKRLFFQIAAGRIPVLYTRKTAPSYFSKAGEWRILNGDKGAIPPYAVQAGGYLQADDLTVGLDEPTDVLARARVSLISETNYDALNDVLEIPEADDLLDTRRLQAKVWRKEKHRRTGYEG